MIIYVVYFHMEIITDTCETKAGHTKLCIGLQGFPEDMVTSDGAVLNLQYSQK